MKNNDLKRKVGLKEVLDEASPDQIESFIEKNKNSGVSDETFENIKTKVFQKTWIENVDTKDERLKSIAEKDKKIYIRRWIYAAAVVLLAVIVAVGGKYINLGDTPPIVSEDTSEDKSTEMENSVESENSEDSENSVDNVNSSHISTDESKDMFQDGDFEIKGINLDIYKGENGSYTYYNAVRNILDNDNTANSEPAWATVILENLTTIGMNKREGSPDLYLSIAEIKVLDFHYYGKDLTDVAKENETIKIFVPYIIENDKIMMSYGNYEDCENKETYIFPMTEIGGKYVVSFYELGHEKTLKIIEENYPEYSELKLHLLSSYPLFNLDASEIKNLSDFNFKPAWPQMYVATYDRHIKGKISENSLETKFYNCFKEAVYNIFGYTPENPRAKSVKDE